MITNAFKPILAKIEENKEWEEKFLKMEKDARDIIEKVRLDNENIHRKYEEFIKKEEKVGEIEFKHETHRHLIAQVLEYLPKEGLL